MNLEQLEISTHTLQVPEYSGFYMSHELPITESNRLVMNSSAITRKSRGQHPRGCRSRNVSLDHKTSHKGTFCIHHLKAERTIFAQDTTI